MRPMYLILRQFSNTDLLYIRRLITEILSNKLPHHERSKSFWEKNSYKHDLHISPANPSKEDLNIYKKYLTGEITNKRVLLLGSTPLLRNLLNEMGFKNYVIADFSFTTIESSLQALNKIGANLDTENEMWLKSDWLEMPLEPEVFDYIVGDMVFTQIEPNIQSIFMKKISSLLKKNGQFIGRMYLCNTDYDNIDPTKIIEEIVASKTFANTIEQRLTLLYRLRGCLRNRNTHTTSPHVITNVLLQYETSDEKKRDFLRLIVSMISKRAEIGLPFITQTKDELKKVISKDLSLETSANASDYKSGYFPIYVLRKKI